MAPLTPHWIQPSHPQIQKVLFSQAGAEEEYTTKSISLIALPPFAVFAKLAYPPCTPATKPTYATVQCGKDEHLNLNSDLVYINHSCEPSVIFDTSSFAILAGPNGLAPNQELTFFYPSTEWDMAQGFTCFCGTASCKGYISGAKSMEASRLEGMFLNAHIRELLEQRDGLGKVDEGVIVGLKPEAMVVVETNGKSNGHLAEANETTDTKDVLLTTLTTSLRQAQALVASTQRALETYQALHNENHANGHPNDAGQIAAQKGSVRQNGVGSRELSGEMGGDTL